MEHEPGEHLPEKLGNGNVLAQQGELPASSMILSSVSAGICLQLG